MNAADIGDVNGRWWADDDNACWAKLSDGRGDELEAGRFVYDDIVKPNLLSVWWIVEVVLVLTYGMQKVRKFYQKNC